MRTQLRTFAAALVLAVAGLAILQAHMKFEKAQPAADSTVTAAPSSIQVFFTQAPDVKVSKLELRGASGAIALTNLHAMGKSLMATVADKMTDGVYTVAWQAAGTDGHVQKGEFKFTLKQRAQ
jgi:methionine-rich copper-binding protein CopC